MRENWRQGELLSGKIYARENDLKQTSIPQYGDVGKESGRQANKRTNRQTGRQKTNQHTDRQTNKQTEKQTDRQTEKQLNKQTHRQADKQTNRQTDKQTNKQTNKQIIKQTDRQTHLMMLTLKLGIQLKRKRIQLNGNSLFRVQGSCFRVSFPQVLDIAGIHLYHV